MKPLEDHHKSLPYRKTNDDTLGNIMVKMLEMYGLKEKFNEVRVKNYWQEQMGASITNYTKTLFIRNHTLFIKLTAASLKQELSYAKEKIKKMMNDLLGEEYLNEVVIL